MKKIVAGILCILLLQGIWDFSAFVRAAYVKKIQTRLEVQMDKYGTILDNFVLADTNDEIIQYPDSYGGAYYDSEGYLHVHIAEESNTLSLQKTQNRNNLVSIAKSEDVLYNVVPFSYNYLKNILGVLEINFSKWGEWTLFEADLNEIDNIIEIHLKNKKQIVSVLDYLSDFDKNAMKFFVEDYEPVTACASYQKEKQQQTVQLMATSTKSAPIGFEVYSSAQTYGTVAFQATRGTGTAKKYGIVTTYDVAPPVPKIYSQYNDLIGYTNASANGNNHNESFVQITTPQTDWKLGSVCTVGYAITSTYSSAQILTGLSVYKSGFGSSTSGQVISANVLKSFGSYSYNVIKISNTSKAGDNGACVGTKLTTYVPGTGNATKDFKLMGMVLTWDSSASYVQNVNVILSSLNIEIVTTPLFYI